MAESGSLLSGAAGYDRPVAEIDPSRRAVESVPPCPVCDSDRALPRFSIEGLAPRLLVCERCGLGRLHPMLDSEEARALYPDEYYGEPGAGRKFHAPIESLVRWVGERHISFLSRGLAPGARVLDVGCGRGVILAALADRGFEVHGVEVSEEAARGADSRAEIRIAPTLAEAGYPAGHFDQIVVWHVLEHLYDPRGALEEMYRVLAPGGRLIVAVPNFASFQSRLSGPAWFHLDLPRHLYHFPLPALRRLLERVGFEVASEHHFSLRQNPFGWIQSWLNRSPRLPRNGLYTLLHRRAAGAGPLLAAPVRLRLWLSFLVMAPFALVATAAGAALRNGATVHLVAHRPPST